ncbi:MAG: NAD-dependent epimerase/dehydratase family protein [Clostridia bacterium]|nr:NAD-dependent epimerase/dehydratase family protein [Clostridia bacterium]
MKETLYLVTGATGFLGGEVCRQLVADGKKVRAFALPNDKAVEFVPKEAEICLGDICSYEDVERFFTVPEDTETVVLHIASVVALKGDYTPLLMNVNIGGTKNIIDCCLNHKECKKLVYCSSTGAIPEVKGRKIKEVIYFDEDQVEGYYSRSKAIATQAVLDAVRKDGLNATVVHPSGILGPGDMAMGQITSTVISILKGSLPMGVGGTFNLCDVRDLAAATIAAVEKGRKGECYILGNEEVTFKEFATGLAKAAGIKPIKLYAPLPLVGMAAKLVEKPFKALNIDILFSSFLVYNLARNNSFDSTKAKTELGYTVRPFSETLKDCVDWLKEMGKI